MHGGRLIHPITCTPKDSLGEVVLKMKVATIHRHQVRPSLCTRGKGKTNTERQWGDRTGVGHQRRAEAYRRGIDERRPAHPSCRGTEGGRGTLKQPRHSHAQPPADIIILPLLSQLHILSSSLISVRSTHWLLRGQCFCVHVAYKSPTRRKEPQPGGGTAQSTLSKLSSSVMHHSGARCEFQ